MPERDVHEEDRAPADAAGQRAADQRADGERGADRRAVDGERLAALARRRGTRRRASRASWRTCIARADALDGAGGVEQLDAVGHPQTSEAAVKMRHARSRTCGGGRSGRRASRRSAPTVASARVYASTTHCRPEMLELRSSAMCESAVLTTAMSSISIAVARQTTASVPRWLNLGFMACPPVRVISRTVARGRCARPGSQPASRRAASRTRRSTGSAGRRRPRPAGPRGASPAWRPRAAVLPPRRRAAARSSSR